MRGSILVLLAGALIGGRAVGLQAQDTTTVRRPDSAAVDSLRRRRDTISTTDRLLQGRKEQRIQLQPLPRPGVASLQPHGTRYSFSRDSIDWAAAQNVGELLARIPGVFLLQADWLGSAEMPDYFGHGAASVEYVLDGVPMLPIGPDSVAVDPSSMPLGILDRVDVETSTSIMRVFLFTRAHDRQSARTKIAVGQGDRGAARYFASFERRYPSGFGLSLAADYLNLNSRPGGSGGNSTPSGWLQLSYAPSPRFGVQAQLVTQSITRNALLNDAGTPHDTLSLPLVGTRTDAQLRGSWHQRNDGLGPSLDLFAAHVAWTSDSVPGNMGIGEFGGTGAFRRRSWSAQLSAFHYTSWTSLDSRLDLGWAPTDRLSGSLQLVAQRHDGDRRSQWATARIGYKLPLGFRIGGTLADGHRVQSPALTNDVAQPFTDAQLTAGFDSHPLTLDVGYARDEGWRAQTYQEFYAIPRRIPLVQTDWVTIHARYAPVGFFTVETVFQNPVQGGLPDGTPPRHTLGTATLRSHFFRNFPSGIFDLKLQAVVENWGAGSGGRDTLGVPIPLPGATFFRAIIQFQIGPFIAYYDRINLQATKTGYVPGYPIQPLGSTFGIRWEFSN